jgi:hypothetical protein
MDVQCILKIFTLHGQRATDESRTIAPRAADGLQGNPSI